MNRIQFVETFIRREEAERSIEEVRGGDPELASWNESGTEGRAHTGTSVPEIRLASVQTELFSRQAGRHGTARPYFPSQVSRVRASSSA
jgi:hypothetical protein